MKADVMVHDAQSIAAARNETGRGQARAADPSRSAWVSANAGTGKTHVLTMRVLRLLLAGTAPEKILCLTYTKAAASEMSNRVFSTLAAWVTSTREDLTARLERVLARQPDERELNQARQLFARAIETPGGLKVQTIHAFAERLLQRFPLEAGIPPNFTILDEAQQRELLREAIDGLLSDGVRNRESPLGRALAKAVEFAINDHFDAILREAIKEHAWIAIAARLGDDEQEGMEEGCLEAAEALLRHIAGVAPGRREVDITSEMAAVLDDGTIMSALVALSDGGKRDADLAVGLMKAKRSLDPGERIAHLQAALLTKDGKPRADSQFISKGVRAASPAIAEALVCARDTMAALMEEKRAIVLAEASMALLRLADSVLQRYADAKRRRAALDYDDLIRCTASLVTDEDDQRPASAQWVLYKLDGGLDHILVDEAQDTSPEQWQIVDALANEFFAGLGSDEKVRTIFAVGDEKQSIYRFQGAEPEKFALMGEKFKSAAEAAGQSWARVPLTLSFRTVSAVLECVDRVFADASVTPGVGGSDPMLHLANRAGQGGLVEIWPTEKPQDDVVTDVWSPLEGSTALPADVRLARTIACTIAGWLETGERLQSENRPITPGDILILVRNRRPFAPLVIQALKTAGIPVAGADRLRLSEQLAVQDLVVLGNFLVLPEDDLALATVLKSPMFALDDDDLMDLCIGRKGTLWSSLLAKAGHNERYRHAADTLKRWRAKSDFAPPFEFFASILEREGMRQRFLSRLGPDAADALDEFLNRALAYDESEPPSLQGFVSWLAGSDHEIKRDMEQGTDQVRVMTVHGAKGLEAPIVFLPDTCRARSRSRDGGLVSASDTGLPDDFPAPLLWPVSETRSVSVVGRSKARADTAERQEYYRLLYVALTRARDRLYVGGYEGKSGRDAGCWYDIISSQLESVLTEVELPDGRKVRRLTIEQTAPHEARTTMAEDRYRAMELPDWIARKAPAEATLSIPLAPSRLAPLEVDEIGDPIAIGPEDRETVEQKAHAPRALTSDYRFQRGIVTHALLEHLPRVPIEDRAGVAKSFVEKRAAMLPAGVRRGIVREVLQILEAPAFAPVFGLDSRSEVPIVAEIPNPSGGTPLRIMGEIDRLAITPAGILIIDYKTNRPPPMEAAGVAKAYLLQLAAYRLAVARIFDTAIVRAAILWTDGPRLMEVPSELLDTSEKELWLRPQAHLDAL